jgi:hypothetical protein
MCLILDETVYSRRPDGDGTGMWRCKEGIEFVSFPSPGARGVDNGRGDEEAADGGHAEQTRNKARW